MSPEVETKIVEAPRDDLLENWDFVKFWSENIGSLADPQITELALRLVAVVSRLAAPASWRGDGGADQTHSSHSCTRANHEVSKMINKNPA